jgi:hypothetical protein
MILKKVRFIMGIPRLLIRGLAGINRYKVDCLECAWIVPTDCEKELIEVVFGMGIDWKGSFLKCPDYYHEQEA